jgi:glycosyltransferase involved in cell wall biosynthesis
MNNPPKVSVVIPTYNREKLLPNAIKSVISQTYSNWELIIVDDRSVDNTEYIVEQFIKLDNRIKYIRNVRGKGPSGARNCGILNSTGKYIAFLDSDDEWLSGHLEESLEILENEHLKVCFSLWVERVGGKDFKFGELKYFVEGLEEVKAKLNPIIKENAIIFDQRFFEFAVITNFYCCHINTLVFRKEITEEIGLFSESLCSSEDNDFIYRIFSSCEFCLLLEYHYIYNAGSDNIYFFTDRSLINPENIITDRSMVNRLTFNGVNESIMRKMLKKKIKQSNLVEHPEECIRSINRALYIKYLSLSFINQKLNKPKAVWFCILALLYKRDNNIFLMLMKILFPYLMKNIKLKSFDIDFG